MTSKQEDSLGLTLSCEFVNVSGAQESISQELIPHRSARVESIPLLLKRFTNTGRTNGRTLQRILRAIHISLIIGYLSAHK
jgi:hypothetical protein